MKLSIVIPAYNEEKYLGDCLEAITRDLNSLILGGQRAVEIVVVNNASQDRTGEVARSFANVKVVDEPQKGLVFARKAGYEASSGDLVANIDADTRMPVGWLSQVFETFESNGKLVALSGPYNYYDLSNWTNFWVLFFYLPGFATHLVLGPLGKGGMVQGGNYVIKRQTLEQMGGFDTSIKFYGEDTDIARRASQLGKVKFDFGLFMYTSGRRLAQEGVITMAIKYSINFFWTLVTARPFSKDYVEIEK